MPQPRYIKSGIVLAAFLFSLLVRFFVPSLERSMQFFGLGAILSLGIVMIAGPLYRLYPEFPLKRFYRASLGGWGIAALYLAALHASFGFFITLGGFSALPFLGNTYLLAVFLGLLALLVFVVMTVVPIGIAKNLLSEKWKKTHLLVHVAALSIAIHIILIGSDFRDWTSPLALTIIIATLVIAILHIISFRRYLVSRFPTIESRIFTALLTFSFIGLTYLLFILHESIIGGHVH